MYNSEELRAVGLPAFVTAEWFRRQITHVEAVGIQKKMAAWLAEHYDNWKGDEVGEVFHEKLRQDLAVAGFLTDFLTDAFRAAKKNSKKRAPGKSIYIMMRITAHARTKPGLEGDPEKAVRDFLKTAREAENWEDLRDMAFYCVITHFSADAVREVIAGTPVQTELGGFLDSFVEKRRLRQGESARMGAEKSQNLWVETVRRIRRIAKLNSPNDATVARAEELNVCGHDLFRAYQGVEHNLGSREFHGAAQRYVDRLNRLRRAGSKLMETGEETPVGLVALEAMLKVKGRDLAKSREADAAAKDLAELVELMNREQAALEAMGADDGGGEDFADMAAVLKAGRERQDQIYTLAARLASTFINMVPEEEDPEKRKAKMDKLWARLEDKWGKNEEWQTAVANNILESLSEEAPDERVALKTRFLLVKMGRAAQFALRSRRAAALDKYRQCVGQAAETLAAHWDAAKGSAESPMGKLSYALAAQLEVEKEPADFNAEALKTELARLTGVMEELAALKKRIFALTRDGMYAEAEPLALDGQMLTQQRDMLADRVLDVVFAKPVPPMPRVVAPGGVKAAAAAAAGEGPGGDGAAAAAEAAEGEDEGEGAGGHERRHPRIIDKINRTVEAFLVRGEFEVAYLLQECGEAILSDAADLKYSADCLECLAYPEKMMTCRFEAVRPGRDAGRVALFAAALFPAVFQLSPSATSLFAETGVFSQLCGEAPHVEGMRRLVMQIGNRAPSPEEFLTAEVPKNTDARAAFAEWYDQHSHKTSGFAAATYAWRNWMRKDGVLGGVILPLLRDEGKAAAREFVRKNRGNRGGVEALIDNEGTKIVGHYREHLQDLFAASVEKIDEFLNAADIPAEGDLLPLCGQLRQSMGEFVSALAETPAAERSAVEACLGRGYRFFDGDVMHALYRGEYVGERLGLRAYPRIPQDGHGMPIDYDWSVIRRAGRELRELR